MALLTIGVATQALTLFSRSASGASGSTGTAVSYTLQGCRGSAADYQSGAYICPDGFYTAGNLGKGWNELDLVPGRVILTAGNTHPASEAYQFLVAVDSGKKAGVPGYDRLSALSLNPALSSPNCPAKVESSVEQTASPGVGGTDATLYRTVTVTNQPPGTTCVYDFYARLALGSHLNSGSSLHFDLYNTAFGAAGIGARDVSIPVQAIGVPGALSKTQNSTQGSSTVWTVAKAATPTSATFTDTCSPTAPTSQKVDVTLRWTRQSANADEISVLSNLSVQNNAHRPLKVSVSDQLYTGAETGSGSPVGPPVVTSGGPLDLAGGASYSFDDTWAVPSQTATAFNDEATATFTDPVFGDVVYTATATASSTVVQVPPTAGATARVTDLETMTGSSHFDFTVTSPPAVGSFSNYTVGTATRGPVVWNSGTLDTSGTVAFAKSVSVLDRPTTDSATLADTATLTPLDSDGTPLTQAAVSDTASTVFDADALVSIGVSKTISLAQPTDETFTFAATGTDGSVGSAQAVVAAGTTGPVVATISGLQPGVGYTITEPAVAPFPGQTVNGVTVDLPSCSATIGVRNVVTSPGSTTTTTAAPKTSTTKATTGPATSPASTTTTATTTTTTTTRPGLAFTGSRSATLSLWGLGLCAAGAVLLGASRLRRVPRSGTAS